MVAVWEREPECDRLTVRVLVWEEVRDSLIVRVWERVDEDDFVREGERVKEGVGEGSRVGVCEPVPVCDRLTLRVREVV